MGIVGDHEDAVAEHGYAAVDAARRIAREAFAAGPLVVPDFAAGSGVERPSGIHVGDVHHAVDHDRRHFQMAGVGDREHPSRRQAGDVRAA